MSPHELCRRYLKTLNLGPVVFRGFRSIVAAGQLGSNRIGVAVTVKHCISEEMLVATQILDSL